MPAYTYQAPAGVPGDITRPDLSAVEPAMLVAATGVYAQKFGIPMKYVSGGIQQYNGGAETEASFAGLLIREVPSISGNNNQGFTDTVPNPDQLQGLLTRGYASVFCARGTPVRGTAVFIQIVANGGVAVGEICATDDSTNAIEQTSPRVEWASDGKDGDGNAEIRIVR